MGLLIHSVERLWTRCVIAFTHKNIQNVSGIDLRICSIYGCQLRYRICWVDEYLGLDKISNKLTICCDLVFHVFNMWNWICVDCAGQDKSIVSQYDVWVWGVGVSRWVVVFVLIRCVIFVPAQIARAWNGFTYLVSVLRAIAETKRKKCFGQRWSYDYFWKIIRNTLLSF